MTLYYLVNSGIEQQATLQYETIFLPARFQLLKIMGIEVNQYESLLPSHNKRTVNLVAFCGSGRCVFCQNVFTKHQGAVRRVGVIKNTAQPMWAGVRCFG